MQLIRLSAAMEYKKEEHRTMENRMRYVSSSVISFRTQQKQNLEAEEEFYIFRLKS